MRQNQKRIDIIVSIVAAVLLWIYVINIANPTVSSTVRDVTVQITGQETLVENGRALAHTESFTTDVTISGPRNDVNKVKAEDIILVADVSALPIGTQAVDLRATMPANIILENIKESSINVTIEEYVTAPKPVEVILSGAKDGQEATVVGLSLSQVEVSGASSVVDAVASLRANGDLSGVELDKVTEHALAITPVDESGRVVENINLAQSTINVSAAIFQTKEVPLEIPVTGSVWVGAELTESKLTKSIIIKGPAEILSQISGIKASEINIEGIYETTSFASEPLLPAGVYLSEKSPEVKAEMIVADHGSLSFSYTAADVLVKNLEEGLTAVVSLGDNWKIDLTVKGPISTLRTLAAGDVAPSVNAANRGAGEVELSISPNQSINGLTTIFDPSTLSLIIR